ncbi:enamine deaminase RidA (YjgF/YER057c/UK114 family) [Rhodococcus sp. PvR044]|jgi:enamine deaminase RidA (YjgF/YER057c/UK114 family)|uniref:RidA family protein n=1 Tax=Rhodococcus TaxID=1827 RepID=UPI000BD4026B|nr:MULTISPECIES: RidA family protein [Rhodococcus]MBP1160477.1 enamine deaminase RidA (YjgF/YER057c/UK114 family) [Rhodococcus sp. PvR099]MCZ4556213.1 RidA family protein [Rhodococcus maanshanensis]PTR36488.1 enamine deaminase RidA (YjgF/YER057c/UK114 family) [Rhodococcus sp. OK611]SNX93975.1 Enamine deaminase RidA, house cleaning of reactive enamine intermediates, YjgF/YER057c/UK114 family [Rhodococcus sp. OK270]
MSNRNNISSGSDWESKIGYSRAVRIGRQVSVSGTTASGPDGPVGGDSLAEQTREAVSRIVAALAEAGAKPEDVIRTRIYLTDMSRWEEAGLAHGEVFGEIRPATTILEVSALIDPALLVEIEADAIIAE